MTTNTTTATNIVEAALKWCSTYDYPKVQLKTTKKLRSQTFNTSICSSEDMFR